MKVVKRYLIWVVLGAVLYFLLSYHLIFIGKGVKLLKKSELTLNYTFFNAKGKTAAKVLAIDELREDGIGDLLVDRGYLSEKELERILDKYERQGD